MTSRAVRAAVAAKIAALPSSRHVWSADEVSGSVSGWPGEFVDDGPHALVRRGPTLREGGTGNQRMIRIVEVEWRFSALASAEAQQLIDDLEDELIVEFSSGITLGGTVIDCVYQGSERPFEEEDVESRPWWIWVSRIAVRERYGVEMSP